MAIKIAGTEVINDNRELVLAKLTEINSSIADTAVDVFVYDTRKDSDGGAWRKRTQHTSWYNETLNTATRGSRKEFPAVAVIVAESNQVTIYDGDDPDLPMWAVLDINSTFYSVFALNGFVCVGTSGGVSIWGFVDETLLRYVTSGKQSQLWTRDVTGSNFVTIDATAGIVNNTVNDVAMTVLPNAPIDAATGLPVPTIAVATDNGVSVIKDDGTVVDGVYLGGSADSHTVALSSNGKIAWTHENGPYFLGEIWSADWTEGTGSNVGGDINGGMFYPAASTSHLSSVGLNTTCTIDAAGSSAGLTKVHVADGEGAFLNGMVNFITSDYNTGWMNGAIKLATLSDTDDTDVTGSELVTNGTFDSDISGWSQTGSGWVYGTNNVTNTTGGNGELLHQSITTVAGKTYVLSYDIVSFNGTAVQTQIKDSSVFGTTLATQDFSAVGTHTLTFTATSTTSVIRFGDYFTSATLDNISVRLAEEDRSVNGNGLQVFGTVTKNPVATGADLVAYSGFNASNYLKQPYNSDLAQVGTGDFCIMAWLKHSDADAYIISIHRPDGVGNNRYALEVPSSDKYRFLTQEGSVEYDDVNYSATDVWHQVVALRRSGTKEIWVNGVLLGTETSTANISSTDAELVIGKDYASSTGNLYSGSIALARISATAPSPEQIARIYNDEKHLFTEGSQATLYGSSDAVTALAYDDSTNILSVGTSAGRSDFQGLRRVNNTTTGVTTSISASNGLIVEQ